MQSINNLPTQDKYASALTLGPISTTEKIVYAVANAAVIVQFAYFDPSKTEGEWGPEILLTPTAGEFQRLQGMRFRSAVAGKPAQVVAQLIQPGDPLPAGGTPFTSILTAAGSIGIAQPPTQTVITGVGAGNYQAPPGCVAILVECIGGGGGGGGCAATAANQVSSASGGGGGGYACRLTANPFTASLSGDGIFSTQVGAGGTAGAIGGNGGVGGLTRFDNVGRPSQVQAFGGGFGGGGGVANPPNVAGGGGAGGLGTVGPLQMDGGPGLPAIALTAADGMTGAGGMAARGGGGGAIATATGPTPGPAGVRYGGGGGGALGLGGAGGGVGAVGGVGAQGVIIVTEFY